MSYEVDGKTAKHHSQSWLLRCNLFILGAVFLVLEGWRPRFFMTDDNLACGFPLMTELGRHLKRGESPIYSDYLFGGHYNLMRDPFFVCWHPFYLLSSLLADTFARFWIMDAVGLMFTVVTTVGFTLLACRLRKLYNPKLPDAYLIFFTFSFVFCNYFLYEGSSWVNSLANQSALPWLMLGILDRKPLRGALIVMVATVHELLGGYAGLTISNGLCMTVFSFAMIFEKCSPKPAFIWVVGNLTAMLVLTPMLLMALDGFAHATRTGGLGTDLRYQYNIPASLFPLSFFMGNWGELIERWGGDTMLAGRVFPFLESILACAAAWCVVPMLLSRAKVRYMEVLCLTTVIVFIVMIMRPQVVTDLMYHVPILKSLRWPFREGLQLLFFFHLLLILRPQGGTERVLPYVAALSTAVFVVPLFFSSVPTFNALLLDRQSLFSGEADAFWVRMKERIKPEDTVATVIDPHLWNADFKKVPYDLLGTANFPQYFQVKCFYGYTTTPPVDQLPVRIVPTFWFGAFSPDQVAIILKKDPHLKLVWLKGITPLKISLSNGAGPPIDVTPDLHP